MSVPIDHPSCIENVFKPGLYLREETEGERLTLTDQMCKQRSKEPLARYSPLGLKATLYTGSLLLVVSRFG